MSTTSGLWRVYVGADDFMATHAAPREDPCMRCHVIMPEGATVWYSTYGDVLCNVCVHLAAAGVPASDPFAGIPNAYDQDNAKF